MIARTWSAAQTDPKIRVNARSTLRQFLKLGDERLRATREVTVKLPELVPITVEHDDRRKSDNLVLLGELSILFSQLGTLRFRARKIEFHQHQVIVRVILKWRLRENISVELDTPATPIRTGEIKEKKFVARLSLFLCLFVITYPGRFGVSELPTE